MRFRVGDTVKTLTHEEGIITGELRADGYYPVKLKRLAYLIGVVHIKPNCLTKIASTDT